MLSYIELDSLCALFGLERDPARAARQALQAAGAIEQVMAELNERLGRQWNCKVTLAVSIHLGRAVVGEIGAFDPPAVIAIGEAVDATNALRKAAAAHGAAFAISQAVYAAAGLDPPPGEEIMVASPTKAAAIPVVLSATAPVLPAPAAPGLAPRAALQRLWGQ
jgi:adenylate cyclase